MKHLSQIFELRLSKNKDGYLSTFKDLRVGDTIYYDSYVKNRLEMKLIAKEVEIENNEKRSFVKINSTSTNQFTFDTARGHTILEGGLYCI